MRVGPSRLLCGLGMRPGHMKQHLYLGHNDDLIYHFIGSLSISPSLILCQTRASCKWLLAEVGGVGHAPSQPTRLERELKRVCRRVQKD